MAALSSQMRVNLMMKGQKSCSHVVRKHGVQSVESTGMHLHCVTDLDFCSTIKRKPDMIHNETCDERPLLQQTDL